MAMMGNPSRLVDSYIFANVETFKYPIAYGFVMVPIVWLASGAFSLDHTYRIINKRRETLSSEEQFPSFTSEERNEMRDRSPLYGCQF